MSETKQRKTRWGCLIIPILFTVLIVAVNLISYFTKPTFEQRLLRAFGGSGFTAPEHVSSLQGMYSTPDFHGDYGISLSFAVEPDQLEKFMHPSRGWLRPDEFRPIAESRTLSESPVEEGNVREIVIPWGSYLIEQMGPGSVKRLYAVHPETRRVFYQMQSW